MQENETSAHLSPKDLHHNLLTSSDFHEVKEIEIIAEEEEYKEYKYR